MKCKMGRPKLADRRMSRKFGEPHRTKQHSALALHRRQIQNNNHHHGGIELNNEAPNDSKPSSKGEQTTTTTRTDLLNSIEFHYKVALKLRPNFALAALNLAAFQYGQLGQRDEARRTYIELCAKGTRPERSKGFHQHVRVQIECLISGSRLYLGANSFSLNAKQTTTTPDRQTKQTQQHEETKTQQQQQPATEAANSHANSSSKKASKHEQCYHEILDWMQLALEKAKQIGWIERPNANTGGVVDNRDRLFEMKSPVGLIDDDDDGSLGEQIGDLSKQLAIIHWMQAKCSRTPDTNRRLELLRSAVGFAQRSSRPIEADIYLDYTELIEKWDAIGLLEGVIRVERSKKRASNNSMSQLYERLSRLRLPDTRAALEILNEALGLDARSVNVISLAAQFSYDLGEFKRSQELYAKALALLLDNKRDLETRPVWGARQSENGRPFNQRLASAYTNYGAILQVNGRHLEARQQYRLALDCDPGNSFARANLAGRM